MARPIIATLRMALVALVFCSAFSLHTAHAAAVRRYVSAQYGYAFSYPASWKAASATGPVNKQFQSPDGATTFAVLVSGGTLTTNAARSTALGAVRSLLNVATGATLQTTGSAPAVVGGVASQVEARGTVNGAHRFAIARAVGYDGASLSFMAMAPRRPASPWMARPGAAEHHGEHHAHAGAAAVHGGAGAFQHVLSPGMATHLLSGPGQDRGRWSSRRGDLRRLWARCHQLIDLRFLLLQNVVLMGSIQRQPAFSNAAVNGKVAQVVQVGIKDKQGRALEAIVADISVNGYNYVVGGAAPRGSASEQAILDTITGASMRPPALRPIPARSCRSPVPATGTGCNGRQPGSPTKPRRGSTRASPRVMAISRWSCRRAPDRGQVLATLTGSMTAGSSGVKKVSTPAKLGALRGQEVVVTQTIIPKQTSNGTVTPALVQETHLLAAASGDTVYVVSWTFYTNAPDAQALQKLAQRAVASFTVGT